MRWWERKHQERTAITEQRDEQKPLNFAESHLARVTFGVDRLPFLKNLLASYQADYEGYLAVAAQHRQVQEIFRSFAMDFGNYFADKWAEGDMRRSNPGSTERAVEIIGAYAGSLLDDLTRLRASGWDGKNVYRMDERRAELRTDIMRHLQSLVDSLEAGGREVTLDIPIELSNQYQDWLLSSVASAVRKSEKPETKL